MHLLTHFTFAFLALVAAQSVAAHEFWLSPDSYQIQSGESVAVNLRVGQNFTGVANSYIPDRIARFESGPPGASLPVTGRLGDRPAAVLTPDREGLYIVIHETTDFRLMYREAEKFARFLESHDLEGVEQQHADRDLPDVGFFEAYRRFSKSLVAVGNGAGADVEVGLDVEIVAETNPYTETGAQVQVLLLEDGQPRPNAQLEVHVRRQGETHSTLSILRTDDRGRALVPRNAGTEVLLNFVVMQAVDGSVADETPVWRSLWASMTYAVP